MENNTEKSFSQIGCAINDHGFYGLFCSKSKKRQQGNNSSEKMCACEAAQLMRMMPSQKYFILGFDDMYNYFSKMKLVSKES